MPPKGWRKNADGTYPQPQKDLQKVSIDDLLFPRTTIQKIAKRGHEDDGPESNYQITKDSVIALQRAATVFVSHLFNQAKESTREANRKVMNTQDIFQALDRIKLQGLSSMIDGDLARWEERRKEKKEQQPEKSQTAQDSKISTEGDDTSHPFKIENEDDIATSDEEEQDSFIKPEQNEDDDKIDVDDEEEEAGEEKEPVNPIAYLAKEEDELQGEENEVDQVNDKNDENDDNDDENDDENDNN